MIRILLTPLLLSGLTLFGLAGAAAQQFTPYLVKDIRPGPISSLPVGLTNVAGTLYFSADDGTTGRELWLSDGTGPGTQRVKDIRSGGSSFPTELTAVGGTLFFSADDGTGAELWMSDGSDAGTMMVKNINQNAASLPTQLTDVAGTLFFVADDGVHGREVWTSDGTADGTELVHDIRPDALSGEPQMLTAVGSKLFFTAVDGVRGRELWASDGAEGGAEIVKDIFDGNLSSAPNFLTNMGGKLYFSADDGMHGRELWSSDGTDTGTQLVKDINSVPSAFTSSNPERLTAAGNKLFFVADDGTESGRELWMSDGTEQGTQLVKDIYPDIESSQPESLTGVGSSLYFTADDGVHGRQLWTTNGTEDGTRMVIDLTPDGGETRFDDSEFVAANNLLFFTASDSNGAMWNSRLYVTNGTEEGTSPVFTVAGLFDSFAEITQLTFTGTHLFFRAPGIVDSGFGDNYELYAIEIPDLSLPGDFNNDGIVDAADYTFWRDGGLTAEQFTEWKNNFGAGASQAGGAALATGIPAASTIPEPAGITLFILAALGAAWQRRSTRQ